MLLVPPYHVEALALALSQPTGAIFVLHRMREEDPAQDGLGAVGANARLFESLLLAGQNGLRRVPLGVERPPQILRRQKHLRHEPQICDGFAASVLHSQRELLRILPEISANKRNGAS